MKHIENTQQNHVQPHGPQALSELRHVPDMLERLTTWCQRPDLFTERRGGHWRRLSSLAFVEQSRRLALGLRARGIKSGDRIALMGPSSSWWLSCDLAIQACGAITVPLFVDASSDNITNILTSCGIDLVFCDGMSCLQSLQQAGHPAAGIIGRGIGIVDAATDYRHVCDAGDELAMQDPYAWKNMLADIDPQATATIIHTSGSTGGPKGACLSHANLLYQVREASTGFAINGKSDLALSCLPLAHVFERMVSYCYLAQGVAIHLVDDLTRLAADLPQIKPTLMTVVPRLLEKMHDRIRRRSEQNNVVKRRLANWAFSLADRLSKDQGSKPGWRHSLADKLVYTQIREALGGRMRCLIVGGAALAEDIEHFYVGMGIPLYQGYGMTEASPVICVNRPAANKVGTVGQAFAGTEVRIDDDNEILVSGPGVMQGYFQPDAEPAVDDQGWLHTGDLGCLDDDGFLHITGRKKELMKTAGGKYVSPHGIEQALRRHALVDRAMVIAEAKPFVSCLLFVDSEQLGLLKQQQDLDVTDADFCQQDSVIKQIDALLEHINVDLDHWQQVRRYHLIPEAPSIEEGMITSTQKLRRHVIEQQYRAAIDAMYATHHAEESENRKESA